MLNTPFLLYFLQFHYIIVKKAHSIIKQDLLLRNQDTFMVKTEFKLKGLCRDIRMDCLHIGAISLAYVLPNPEWYVPPHSHTGFEIHIIPKGRGVINIEGTEFAVGPGEFYITGPFVKHEQTTDKSSPMGEYCLECDISIIDEASTPAALQQAQLIRRVLSGVYPRLLKMIRL